MTDLTLNELGVVGAGVMGAGIAQLGVLAGFETTMYDPHAEALEQGRAAVERGLAKGADRGRWTDSEARAAGQRLATATDIGRLATAQLVIEAAPERLDLKRDVFAQLSSVCSDEAVLATNTSSIPVAEVAAAVPRRANVVGMHFFNPPPAMRLVEVIGTLATERRALDLARSAAERMGKRVIEVPDVPGFLVNRCGRPFYAEALRMLQERVADHERIDQVSRVHGGFRMGPFEVMDLVGIDTNLEIAKSFMQLSFGEPRWKPSPMQAAMTAAGRVGRKAGRGWYDYSEAGAHRPEDPPHLSLERLEQGIKTPGRILDRLHACIVNEAVFALGEGIASARVIDLGVTLGLNWPMGSIELGRQIGFERVLTTLDELYDYYREERYGAAPLLRAKAVEQVISGEAATQ